MDGREFAQALMSLPGVTAAARVLQMSQMSHSSRMPQSPL